MFWARHLAPCRFTTRNSLAPAPAVPGTVSGAGWGQRVLFCKLCLKLFLMTSSFFGIGTGRKKDLGSKRQVCSMRDMKEGRRWGVEGVGRPRLQREDSVCHSFSALLLKAHKSSRGLKIPSRLDLNGFPYR